MSCENDREGEWKQTTMIAQVASWKRDYFHFSKDSMFFCMFSVQEEWTFYNSKLKQETEKVSFFVCFHCKLNLHFQIEN